MSGKILHLRLFTVALLLAGRAAVAADAGVFLRDEFESATVIQPPTFWGSSYFLGSPPAAEATADCAHRGATGLRLTDPMTSGNYGPYLSANSNDGKVPVLTGEVYGRTWFRVLSGSNGSAAGYDAETGLFALTPLGQGPLSTVRYLHRDQTVTFGGNDATSVPDYGHARTTLDAGWHLFELGAIGVGTTNGTRTFWLDGKLQGTSAGRNLTGAAGAFKEVQLGLGYAEVHTFTGQVCYDDVRASTSPPASTLKWVGLPTSLAVGACAPVQVGLFDSSGQPAMAPYAVSVNVSATGATFYPTADCASAVTSISIAPGSTSASGFVRFSSATGGPGATLSATHEDFLGGSAVISLTNGSPDAGTVTMDGYTLTPPLAQARCGVAYSVSPTRRALLSGPSLQGWKFSAAPEGTPAGFSIDERTGEVTWFPSAGQRGVNSVVVVATNGTTTLRARADVVVTCESAGGCSTAGALPQNWLWVLACVATHLGLRRARRSRA